MVGYASFALDEQEPVSHADAGSTLLSLARGAIDSEVSKTSAEPRQERWLAQAGATFVTLMRAGKLRGCIGSLEAVRPLGTDVAENARGAAFRDPRFPALAAELYRTLMEGSGGPPGDMSGIVLSWASALLDDGRPEEARQVLGEVHETRFPPAEGLDQLQVGRKGAANRAFHRASSYSASAVESATMPPPTFSTAAPPG